MKVNYGQFQCLVTTHPPPLTPWQIAIHIFWSNLQSLGFPGGKMVTNLPDKEEDAGDTAWIPGMGRSPGIGNGNPLQYSCLWNPWREEPSGQQSMVPKRVRHKWMCMSRGTEFTGVKMNKIHPVKCQWSVLSSLVVALDHRKVAKVVVVIAFEFLPLSKATYPIAKWFSEYLKGQFPFSSKLLFLFLFLFFSPHFSPLGAKH